jgi:hypothetical protein
MGFSANFARHRNLSDNYIIFQGLNCKSFTAHSNGGGGYCSSNYHRSRAREIARSGANERGTRGFHSIPYLPLGRIVVIEFCGRSCDGGSVLGGAGLAQGRTRVAQGMSTAVGQGARRSTAHKSRVGGVGHVWHVEDRTSGQRLFCRWCARAGGRARRPSGMWTRLVANLFMHSKGLRQYRRCRARRCSGGAGEGAEEAGRGRQRCGRRCTEGRQRSWWLVAASIHGCAGGGRAGARGKARAGHTRMRPVGLSLAPFSPLMHRCVDQHVEMPQEGGFEPEDLGSH